MNIAVLVSGGVDSSVALRIAQEQGHQVTAFYLKIWLEDELSYLGQCPWEEDLAYVRAVCDQAQVPLQVISLQKEYHEQIVAYVISEVQVGRTPNPDMLCNKRIKFGLFLSYIDREFPAVFDKIASGHYAQVREHNGTHLLIRSPDPIKDQTYFLAYLDQTQLSRIIFPIGHLAKHEVRAYAQQYNLPNKDRKDSQGICFLGTLKFEDFIRHYVGDRTGNLVEYETSTIVGQHKGFWYFTIGQRHGIRLAGGPWYVVSKDPTTNTIFISKNYYDVDKERNNFTITNCNWLYGPPNTPAELQVKLRHGAMMHSCSLTALDAHNAHITLATRDQGIAAGQFAVFYQSDVCLGTGMIL